MNILIVDDIIETCEYISTVITRNYNNINCICTHSYDDAIMILDDKKFDVIILDYELDKCNESKNGLALGQYISMINSYKNTPVVFETSYPEHIYPAVNSLNCVYYMLKPFYEKDIVEMMNKILYVIPYEPKLSFHNSVGICTLIKISDIACIQSCRHDIIVYTLSCKYHFTNYSLSNLENDSFGKLIRCHKSYIINPDHIEDIDKSNRMITFSIPYENLTVPIGRKYSDIIYGYCNNTVIY